MLPTHTRDAVVDEHNSSVSSAADRSLPGNELHPLLSNDLGGDCLPVSSNDFSSNDSTGDWKGSSSVFGSVSFACSTFLTSCRNGFFAQSPTFRSCGKKLSTLWKRKMLVLSNWMGHLSTNWKAMLRYVLGDMMKISGGVSFLPL